MPSGTSVSANYYCFGRNDCLLDIYVYPLAEDFGNSAGLCGNYNDNATDDLTVQGSNVVDSVPEPVQFAKSHM